MVQKVRRVNYLHCKSDYTKMKILCEGYVRLLKVADNSFQYLNFEGSMLLLFISCNNGAAIIVSKKAQSVLNKGHGHDVTGYHSNNVTC